jgi:SAM-dependent methyltransferase
VPFPDEYFDIVHARGVHTGVSTAHLSSGFPSGVIPAHARPNLTTSPYLQMRNYPLFLEEVARVLRPGGLVILIENEIKPITEGKVAIEAGPRGGAPGWHAFWEQYRRCLTGNGIDTTVPTRLPSLLAATGAFDDVVAQEATIPVGFWPKGACLTDAFFPLPPPFQLPPLHFHYHIWYFIWDLSSRRFYEIRHDYNPNRKLSRNE